MVDLILALRRLPASDVWNIGIAGIGFGLLLFAFVLRRHSKARRKKLRQITENSGRRYGTRVS
jgi:hypothetical protein